VTNEQFINEQRYQFVNVIVRMMLGRRIITEDEYRIIDTIMLEKYRPLLGGLYANVVYHIFSPMQSRHQSGLKFHAKQE